LSCPFAFVEKTEAAFFMARFSARQTNKQKKEREKKGENGKVR
jgi:hypothetical protein